jgi:hypothetical protein
VADLVGIAQAMNFALKIPDTLDGPLPYSGNSHVVLSSILNKLFVRLFNLK